MSNSTDYAHYHLRDFGVSSGACQPYEEADDTCVDYCPGDDSQIRRFRYSKVYTPGADEEDIMVGGVLSILGSL